MKKQLLLACTAILLAMSSLSYAADANIALPKPVFTNTTTLSQALLLRRTIRDFVPTDIPLQTLSHLLWAGNGVNRQNGRLVVPAAIARYAISLYVLRKDGAYRHDRANNTLVPVTKEDLRQYCNHNPETGAHAGVCILMVADANVFANRPMQIQWSFIGMEAGAIMQDIYLACAAENLGTVCCASLDAKTIRKALKLEPHFVPYLAMIIGVPAQKELLNDGALAKE